MTDQTGKDDQRYVNRDDHDAARAWFQKQYKQKNRKPTREEAAANLARLRKLIEEKIDGN